MSLSAEQQAVLRRIQHERSEALADYGTESDSSTAADLAWAGRVDQLMEIITALTGACHQVVITLTLTQPVQAFTARGLLYGMGAEGLDFTAEAPDEHTLVLSGTAPRRLDLETIVREWSATTTAFLVTKTSGPSVTIGQLLAEVRVQEVPSS